MQDRFNGISFSEFLEPLVHFGQSEAVLPACSHVGDDSRTCSHPFNSHVEVSRNARHANPWFDVKFAHNHLV